MSESMLADNLDRAPTRLVDQYHPESSVFFSSSRQALLARPPFASLLVAGMRDLPEQVSESLRLATELGFDDAVVVGAIPFDVKGRNYLRVSTNVQTQAVQRNEQAEHQRVDLGDYRITSSPDQQQYRAQVKQALQRFARGELDKVVLSRALDIECEKRPDVGVLVRNLEALNQHGYTFAIDLPENNAPRTAASSRALIGASPELLISRTGNRIIANPLAGSEPRSSDPRIDEQRAQDLLHSEKDRREHALVIRAIETALRPFCKTLHIPDQPSLINTRAMWHLSTRIEGELIDSLPCSLTLALAMHPTPAVCGFPGAEAAQVIEELEPYQRDLFTGMVGWCDAKGDGEWVVTIRCAEVNDRNIRLYAGAGIVAGSDPDKEFNETEAKFRTMRHAMGI